MNLLICLLDIKVIQNNRRLCNNSSIIEKDSNWSEDKYDMNVCSKEKWHEYGTFEFLYKGVE